MSSEQNSNMQEEENQIKFESRHQNVWLIGAVIAVLLLLWFAPPLAAEMVLANNIDGFINAAEPDRVTLDTTTIQVVQGRFKSFHITGKDLVIGNLLVSEYDFDAGEGQLDVMKYLTSKTIVMKKNPIIKMRWVVTVADFSKLLEAFYPSIWGMDVVAVGDSLQVSGVAASPSGIDVPVEFKVKLSVDQWEALYLEAYDLNVDIESVMEAGLAADLTEIYSLSIPFDKTSPPIFIDSAQVSKGQIIITASSSLK